MQMEKEIHLASNEHLLVTAKVSAIAFKCNVLVDEQRQTLFLAKPQSYSEPDNTVAQMENSPDWQ